MNTRLTIALSRSISQQFASSPANFLGEVNTVQEKLLRHAMWNDALQIVEFKNPNGDGVVTLPPFCASVVGWQLFGQAEATFDMFREWQEGGVGYIDPKKHNLGDFYELPSGEVVETQISSYGPYGNLMLALNNPVDAGKQVRFFFEDQNGEDVYDPNTGFRGIAMTTAAPNATLTPWLASRLTGIQLPGFIGSCILYIVINGAASQLAYYNPGETLPYYRRYKVGRWQNPPNVTPRRIPIRCFCRRQYVPCAAETDFIFPGVSRAIEFGLQALKEDRANNYVAGLGLWQKAYDELDDDLQQYRGAAQTTLRLEGMALPRSDDWRGCGGWGNGTWGGWGVVN